MWRTQYGDRILGAAEATVFAEALLNLFDEVSLCDFDDYELGIKCFDTLTFGHMISVLTTIGNGLFRKDVKSVESTAVLEAGIAEVFEHLKNKIIIEITEPALTFSLGITRVPSSASSRIIQIFTQPCAIASDRQPSFFNQPRVNRVKPAGCRVHFA